MTTNPESEAGKLRRIEHDPDGVTTEFSVPFRWVEDSDIVAYLIADDATETPTLWLINIDYTLVANADPVDDTGGKIIATTAPTGRKLLIWAETKRSQEVKYEEGGDFPSESHEFALDKNALVDQEDARDLGRALRAPDTDINGLNEIPPRVDRANQALVFDGDGQPSAGGISEKGQLLTSEYGEGLVLVANATAGRSYLGAAGAADVTTLNGKIDAIIGVGWVRDRIDETDLTPTFIPLDGRTIGKASSGADVANDGLRALFDIAKMVPNTGNTGTEDFDAGDTVQLPDMRGCTRISTGQRAGLTLRTLGDFVGGEGNDTVDGATGAGGSVASTAADSNMQPSYAVPFEVYSGVLPSLEQINLGQLGITWDPSSWAAATPYVRNAALRNGSAAEGRSYIALQDHTSSADDEPGVGVNWQTYWAIMNYDGSPGGVGNWRGTWSALTPYVANDAVEHNGSSWIAIANSTGSEPGVAPEWDLQAAKGDDGAPGEVQAVDVQDGRHLYLTNIGGTGNDITAQANPTLTAWTEGQRVVWKVGTANGMGKMTMVVDGLAAIPIQDRLGASPPSGFYAAGSMAEAVYDGANLIDLSIPVSGAAGAARGFQFSNSGASTVLNYSAGETFGVAVGSGNRVLIALAAAGNKDLSLEWSAGSGNGGRAQGVAYAANTWYHFHAIKVGGVDDFGFDDNVNATNLINNHGATAWEYAFSVRTDGVGNIGGFKNFGDTVLWDTLPLDVDDNASNAAEQLYTLSTPPDIRVLAELNTIIDDQAATANTAYIYCPDLPTAAPSNTVSPLASIGFTVSTAGNEVDRHNVYTNKSSQIACTNQRDGNLLKIATIGWRYDPIRYDPRQV